MRETSEGSTSAGLLSMDICFGVGIGKAGLARAPEAEMIGQSRLRDRRPSAL